MSLLFKAIIGAAVVIVIALLSKSRLYYIAGLVPLFPTFGLIAHYIVGNERGIEALRTTLIFGLWAIIPYIIYLLSLFVLVGCLRLPYALLSATACWCVAAWLLIVLWRRWYSM
ncbi:GlpM family protein [Biostraticola tofi]|uniref:Putative membrane protein (GlpM family) n=1 Tax=Biostraticola tofi TaxID=466109 RepID=A0A4R3YZX4_9GAMM|nr:GlpM family protein [Biostraticola tofi]TCV98206.1 putative membrane protein (GlpM family) [Biostraticola tofi]